MYIESVPNRGSPPAILLRESYRDGGKVKKRTLLNLSDWPQDRIAGFKMLLKGGTVIPKDQDAITIVRSLPHGHVAAALGTARKIGLDRLLGPTATAAAISSWPWWSAACSISAPSSPPPARCRRTRPAPVLASSSVLAWSMRTSSTAPSIG
jgi:hypothetical protein